MDSIRLKARAKINLGLDVLGKRDNGYHDVRMVMQTVGIYDRLIINKIPEDDIRIDINLKFLPVNENNLIYKAYKLMKDEYGFSGGIELLLCLLLISCSILDFLTGSLWSRELRLELMFHTVL